MSKNFVIALAVSLTVNIFLCGFLIGSHLQHGPSAFSRKDDRPPPPPEMMMFDMAEKGGAFLSPEGQRSLSSILEKQTPSVPEEGFGEKMDEMRKILTAEKLDLPKLEALQKEINSTEDQHRKGEGQLIMEIARTLSDKDRITFFETLLPRRMGPPMGPPPYEDGFNGEFDEFFPTERP